MPAACFRVQAMIGRNGWLGGVGALLTGIAIRL
jgi:hypothetical protein